MFKHQTSDRVLSVDFDLRKKNPEKYIWLTGSCKIGGYDIIEFNLSNVFLLGIAHPASYYIHFGKFVFLFFFTHFLCFALKWMLPSYLWPT